METQDHHLMGGSKNEFNNFYKKVDPWDILKSSVEIVRCYLVFDMIKAYLKYPEDSYILEFGCGEGVFSEILSNQNIKTEAVDISDVAITRALQKKLPGVNFVASDMLDYALNNSLRNYDIILMMECFYYLMHDERERLMVLLAEKTKNEIKIFVSLPMFYKDRMVPSEASLINLFERFGFICNYESFAIPLTLKGLSLKIFVRIPFMQIKKHCVRLHKYIFSQNINQKLYIFTKN